MRDVSPYAKVVLGFSIVMAAAGLLAGCALYLIWQLGEAAAVWAAEGGGSLAMEQAVRSSMWKVVGVGAAGTAVSLGAMLFVSRTFASALGEIARRLEESSRLALADAEQLADSSQGLAAGASKQAASLEETSSSLEEMASMIEKNTGNAQEANRLTTQAREAADQGARDMEEMSEAMLGIQSSSDEVGEIIKTIDEIAFQTNILALNAAVEAARAGNSGAGFAVVADEVRSLAQRSAKAASETTSKIENAIARTRQGVALSQRARDRLRTIVAINRSVDSIAAEVADASQQQSEGIRQLRNAVFEIDSVTQSNAAAAEQSASATQGLRQQAVLVRGAVDELKRLVARGGRARSARSGAQGAAARRAEAPETRASGGSVASWADLGRN